MSNPARDPLSLRFKRKNVALLFFPLIFCLSPLSASIKEALNAFDLNLKHPVYRDGLIETQEGGIIENDQMRIQAQRICYLHREGEQKVIAEGNLVVDFGGRILSGERLEYDFIAQTGRLEGAVVLIDLWTITAEEARLNPDQSLTIKNATVTTSETEEAEWDIKIKKLVANCESVLSAKDISFRFFKIPILWLPAFKSQLTLFTDTPVRYKITWDKGQGPRLSLRYRFFSNETWNLFFRVDGRTKRGFGGALEGDYRAQDKRTHFLTRNYLAHDTFYNDDDPNKKKTRFRLQGLHTSRTESGSWTSFLTWDKISDKNMPGDFKSDDFEINTARRTQWLVRNQEDRHIAGLNVRARINSFQGFKQELPSLNLSLRPFELGDSGIIMENSTRSAYLDYVYSDDLSDFIHDFHAMRLETRHKLYRPFNLNFLRLSPYAGFTGIFYNNNPVHRSVGQALFEYGGSLLLPLEKTFPKWRHHIAPYLSFEGISKPTLATDQLFIFDIADGYHRMNMLKVGVKSHLFSQELNPLIPRLSCDLYGLAFFADTTFSKRFPKAYAEIAYQFPRMAFFADLGWNFQDNLLDRANLRFLWTLSSDVALSFEFRHRSRFDWRKDDHDNYILDVTRPLEALLHSPLSDGRNTFLAKLQMQLVPGWTLRVQTHSGWGRSHQPGYTETYIDLLTKLTSAWQLRLSYMHTVRTDQVTFGLSLTPNP